MSPCLCNSQIVTGKQNTRASRKKKWMFALLCVSIASGVICFLMVLDIKRNRYVQTVSKTNSNTELGSSAHRNCVLSLGFTCKYLLDTAC